MRFLVFLLASLFIAASIPDAGAQQKRIATDFRSGADRWSAGFADYPVGEDVFFELQSGMRRLPASTKRTGKAFLLSGNNHSDDLCMFLFRKVSGLAPNTRYLVRFSITFASNAPEGIVGVGGSPGESVYMKAGVSRVRPRTMVSEGYLRLNIDKGNQSAGGRNAVVIGNVGVPIPWDSAAYRLKTLRTTAENLSLRTGSTGDAWIFVGTDSGFEATTTLYFTRIVASFTPR